MVSQAVSDFFKSILPLITHLGFPGGTSGKESTCQHKRCRFGPQVGKTPWRRKCQPTPVSLTEKFHGQSNLVGYIPWGHKEQTQLRTHIHRSLTCESSSPKSVKSTYSESLVAQSCPTLWDTMDCRLPGSSIHGIFQARVLEWAAIAFSNPICNVQ